MIAIKLHCFINLVTVIYFHSFISFLKVSGHKYVNWIHEQLIFVHFTEIYNEENKHDNQINSFLVKKKKIQNSYIVK